MKCVGPKRAWVHQYLLLRNMIVTSVFVVYTPSGKTDNNVMRFINLQVIHYVPSDTSGLFAQFVSANRTEFPFTRVCASVRPPEPDGAQLNSELKYTT